MLHQVTPLLPPPLLPCLLYCRYGSYCLRQLHQSCVTDQVNFRLSGYPFGRRLICFPTTERPIGSGLKDGHTALSISNSRLCFKGAHHHNRLTNEERQTRVIYEHVHPLATFLGKIIGVGQSVLLFFEVTKRRFSTGIQLAPGHQINFPRSGPPFWQPDSVFFFLPRLAAIKILKNVKNPLPRP